jgi:transposase
MFWAGFSIRNRTSLVALPGDPESANNGVTGRVILDCLQANLPTICEPSSVFMQDNAPTHKARLVQNWLIPWTDENGISRMDWPPYSPDLNPIENLWHQLKDQICQRYPDLGDLPKNQASKDRLIRAAIEVWEELEVERLETLIRSMPKRMRKVVAADGWYTKY